MTTMANGAQALLSDISGGRVLDVAGGGGRFVQFLIDGLKDYREIVGTDADPNRAADFRERFGDRSDIRFETMDALKPTFPDHSFDTVCLAHSLCQFETPVVVLRRLRRLVRPGGHMIVVAEYRVQHSLPTLNHSALHDWWAEVDRFTGVSHWPDLTRGDLITLLAEVGLFDIKLADAHDEGDPMDPVVLAGIVDVIDKFAARVAGEDDLVQRGQALRVRIAEVGFLEASTLVAVGAV
jgi:SAM-dependent methyltransferase